MSWFEKLVPSILTSSKPKTVPEGLWDKCPKCEAVLFKADLTRNMDVCSKCEYHIRIKARKRLDYFLDVDSKIEIGKEVIAKDRLKFKDTKKYKDRLTEAKKNTKESEALVVMIGSLKQIPIVACAFEFDFIGGSMGAAVGQKFVLAVEHAIKNECPLVCFAASGGARMQESLLALMQMAKTTVALNRLSRRGLPYISVMTNPCMGGVSASLAMLGDINIGEPGARIGFSGPRVIVEYIKEDLPETFQDSKSLLDSGFLDLLLDRRQHRDKIASIISKLMGVRIE